MRLGEFSMYDTGRGSCWRSRENAQIVVGQSRLGQVLMFRVAAEHEGTSSFGMSSQI